MPQPILCPVRNNLHLTRKAIKTFRDQDIAGGVEILVVNNASTDGTTEWLNSQSDLQVIHKMTPYSVAKSWNTGLEFLFSRGHDHVLVVNNDVELLPYTYRYLLAQDAAFVTPVSVREFSVESGAPAHPLELPRRPHPDFSCFLIRRDTYRSIGPFDENFKIAFCEDGDYDIRMFKAGIRAFCIDMPFLHHGSATIKNADPQEIKMIQKQADANRAYFAKKWGFPMASPEYYAYMRKDEPMS